MVVFCLRIPTLVMLHVYSAFNCRLEFEDRNIKKEKKELAAYEAFVKSQNIEKTE